MYKFLIQTNIPTFQHSIIPSGLHETCSTKNDVISIICTISETLNYPILGTIVLKYPDMIAKESKNIKTPVTMSKTPVAIDMTLICRFSLWKYLRKVLIPRDVSINGIASPME
jgi:hypothetical protein